MKIVKIKGGLGNQMFQYAFAKNLTEYSDEKVVLDYSAFNLLKNDRIRKPRIKNFCLKIDEATRQDINEVCFFSHEQDSLSLKYKLFVEAERIINPNYYFEKNRCYRNIDKILKFSYFDGYWQSWRYVESCIEELLQDFEPSCMIKNETKQMIDRVSNENSVFIGVRRGDYEAEKNHYGSFGKEYYYRALNIIESQVNNPKYFIFSNDVEWTKENLNFGNRNVVYREDRDVIDDFDELLIMANCRHSIIINSTYHWWGARLKYYPGKIVIAPKKWFFDDKPIDIVPPNWISI